MRKALVYLILIVSAIVLVCTYLVSTCIGLLFENGLQWAIQPNDLPLRDAWREDQRPIPKIIHQTWKNETIPEQWTIAHYTCLDLHPDYQYIVSSLYSCQPVCFRLLWYCHFSWLCHLVPLSTVGVV